MRKLGIGLAALLLAGVLAVTTAPPATAGVPCDATHATGFRTGPFVLQTQPLSLTPTLKMEAQLVALDCAGGFSMFPVSGATVVFRSGGQLVCQATTDFIGVASCSVTANLPGALLALVTLQAQASFAGDGFYAPSTATVSAFGGPMFPPTFPL